MSPDRRDLNRSPLLLCILVIGLVISLGAAFIFKYNQWYGEFVIPNMSATELCEKICSGKLYPAVSKDVTKCLDLKSKECFQILIREYKASDSCDTKMDTLEYQKSNNVFNGLAAISNDNWLRIYSNTELFNNYDPEQVPIYILCAEKAIDSKEKAGVDFKRIIDILTEIQRRGALEKYGSPTADHATELLKTLGHERPPSIGN